MNNSNNKNLSEDIASPNYKRKLKEKANEKTPYCKDEPSNHPEHR
ncbi:MAG: hypothetical protein SPJ62_00195 [Inconstantimicrobium porci]|nr:hypothetical protein [Inconstantimicrobium porci]MDD6770329.1 hypothetical protein [Inconstantimicrobium porci]MDY5910446.1 hypothetical protein [Inconstantimicrobium porci]